MRPPVHRDGDGEVRPAPRPAPSRALPARRAGLLLGLVAFTATLSAALDAATGAARAEPAPTQPVSVYHNGCGAPGCEIRLTFSAPMVKMPRKGDLEGAGPVELSFTPPMEGAWRWRDDRNLIFKPAKGEMGYGAQAKLNVARAIPLSGPKQQLAQPWEGTVYAPEFYAAGKTAWWPVIDGQPRFVAFLNDYTRMIGDGPLYLLYDQPVSPKKLRAMISARDDAGRPLPLSITRPRSIKAVWADGDVDLRHVVALKLRRQPKAESQVHLALPTWDDNGPTFSNRALIAKGDFTVGASEFYGEVNDIKRAPREVQLSYRFDRPVRTEALRKYLDVKPAPESIYMWSYSHEVVVSLSLAPGTDYRVALKAGMPDVLGNRLTRADVTRLRTADLPPRMRVSQRELLLEPEAAAIPVTVRNLKGFTATLHAVESPEAFVTALGQDDARHCGDYPGVEAVGEPLAVPYGLRRTHLMNTEGHDLLPIPDHQGLFCLNLSATTRGSEAEAVNPNGRAEIVQTSLIQIADLAATVKVADDEALVWLTGLRSGAPVAQGQIQLIDGDGALRAGGFTDAHGVIRLDTPGGMEQGQLLSPMYLMARHGDQSVLTLLDNEHLSHAWQFGLPGPVVGHDPLQAAAFTERGVYRPGETVYGHLMAPALAGEAVQVALVDARGRTVAEPEVRLDGLGVGAVEIPLKETAATGTYTLRFDHAGEIALRSLLVEEYRVPTFQVGVSAPKAEWRPGQTVQADIQARYLHGGALAGRSVKYTVDRVAAPISAPAFPDYAFGGDPAEIAQPQPPRVAEGEAMLDDAGDLKVRFPVARHQAPYPQRYVLWAEVTDVDRQAYAGRLSRVIHPTDRYLGTAKALHHRVAQAGREIEVPVIAVDTAGRPQAGIRAKVVLEQVEHRSVRRVGKDGEVRWENHTHARKVQTCRVRTAKVARRCALKLPKAGQYRVRVLAKDTQGRQITTGFELRATGYQPTAWPRFDQDKITVVSDKARYQPGETARLLVESPFEQAWGLATVEQAGVRWHKAFRIDGDTPAVEVPIVAEDAPRVYAAVTLVRGRIHGQKNALGLETGAPAFKLGYAPLEVATTAQRLKVQVSPTAPITPPGSEAVVDLEINGPDGAPVDGQAVVMVVDEAVLGLTGYRTPDPVTELLQYRPLAVRTGEGRLELPQARIRRYALSPAGDGGGQAEMKMDTAQDQLRQIFKTTAFIDPRVKIVAGRGRVRFTLPDNMTTYRVMAVAVDAAGHLGAADSAITLRKPLMVQAVIPRFVYPEDTLDVEALVYNATEADGEVEVSARFLGMTSARNAQPASLSVSDQPMSRATVKADATGTFSFPVRVDVPTPVDGLLVEAEATVELMARMGDLVDRVQVKVPVLNPGSARVDVAHADVRSQMAETLALSLPASRHQGTGQFEINVSSTSLTRLSGAVDYLMGYPNGCLEQTTSRTYPLVMLEDLLPEMGVKVDPAKLKAYATAGVKRLLSFQTPEGGLSYWPGGDKPHAFGTAFALSALIEARGRGYDVPQPALDRMANYLERALRAGAITESMPHGDMADADTRAFFVMTLGRLDRPQVEYIQTLWQGKEKLTPFGLGFLATAVSELKGQPAAQGLLPEILSAIEAQTHKDTDEAWYTGARKGGYSFDSPLRTHAAALMAFAGADAHQSGPLSGKLLNGLLNRQKYGLWGNTQENVFGVMGVARYIGGGPSAEGDDLRFELQIQGQPIPADRLKVEKLGDRTHRVVLSEADVVALLQGAGLPYDPEGDLAPAFTVKNPGGKPLTVTARADYHVNLKPEDSAPIERGLKISRSYTTLDGLPIGPRDVIPLGAVVRVRVEVAADRKTSYLAIDDKLPAGLEPMNAAFATSAPAKLFGDTGAPDTLLTAGLRVLSHHEIRDSRVAFYVDQMPKGSVAFTYLARATTPGVFRRPAARAEAMYDPETVGTTAIDTVIVAPNQEG